MQKANPDDADTYATTYGKLEYDLKINQKIYENNRKRAIESTENAVLMQR